MKIGIIDSGIGGYSLVPSLKREVPWASFYYLCDSTQVPYGNKGPEEVRKHVSELVEELIQSGVQLVVLACNTATTSHITHLREEFQIPFVGVEPFVNARRKLGLEQSSSIGLIATSATMKSQRLVDLLDMAGERDKIKLFPLLNLAKKIEDYFQNPSDMNSLLIELDSLRNEKLDYLVLGCTHYPLIKDKISEYLNIQTIDSSDAVAKRVRDIVTLPDKSTLSSGISIKNAKNSNWLFKSWKEFDRMCHIFG